MVNLFQGMTDRPHLDKIVDRKIILTATNEF